MMKILVIDGQGIRTEEEFYRQLKKELSLPDYFGNNLDALHDVLTEFFHSPDSSLYESEKKPGEPDGASAESAAGLRVEFINYDALREHLGDIFCARLTRVLEDAEISAVIKQSEQQSDEL